MSRQFWITITILVSFSAVYLSYNIIKESRIRSTRARTVAQPENSQFKSLPPKAHLELARKALETGYKPDKNPEKTTWGNINEAKRHLSVIPKIAPEHEEAQKLFTEIDRREREIWKIAEKNIQRTGSSSRVAFAKSREELMLLQGYDFHISTEGDFDTTLKIKYVLMNRPFAYQLVNDKKFMENLRNLRFKSLTLTDGYDFTWEIGI